MTNFTSVDELHNFTDPLKPDPSVEQITDVNDPRLVQFWLNAHKKADDRGYCETYEQIATDLGLRRELAYQRKSGGNRATHQLTVTFKVKVQGDIILDVPVSTSWRGEPTLEALDQYLANNGYFTRDETTAMQYLKRVFESDRNTMVRNAMSDYLYRNPDKLTYELIEEPTLPVTTDEEKSDKKSDATV